MNGIHNCTRCGRRAKRHCPALKAPLCPPCCASQRGITIECAGDCGFFPFAVAGYDLWLNLDTRLSRKIFVRMLEEKAADQIRKIVEKFLTGRREDETELDQAREAALFICLLWERDERGKSLADRWEKENWRGLDPAEALMMKYRRRTFVTVIEIQRKIDHQTLECVDLFDPSRKPFVILDRSLPSQVVRFDRLFTAVTHYPHFSRAEAICLQIPELIRRDFIDLLMARSQGKRRAFDETAAKSYLAEHLPVLTKAIYEMHQQKLKSIFSTMDVQHCRAEYALRGERKEIENILKDKPDFEWDDREPDEGDPPGTDYYIWLRVGESQEIEKAMPAAFRSDPDGPGVGILGNLKLLNNRLVFEAFSKQKYEFGKKILGKYFGTKLELIAEKVVDIARQAAERWDRRETEVAGTEEEEDLSPDTLPPEVRIQMIEEGTRRSYRKFLDEKIPALGELTPREAARNPQSRLLLIELMKEHINGLEKRNRTEGTALNIDLMLKELGLDELI